MGHRGGARAAAPGARVEARQLREVREGQAEHPEAAHQVLEGARPGDEHDGAEGGGDLKVVNEYAQREDEGALGGGERLAERPAAVVGVRGGGGVGGHGVGGGVAAGAHAAAAEGAEEVGDSEDPPEEAELRGEGEALDEVPDFREDLRSSGLGGEVGRGEARRGEAR